jgi:hypothetical protein
MRGRVSFRGEVEVVAAEVVAVVAGMVEVVVAGEDTEVVVEGMEGVKGLERLQSFSGVGCDDTFCGDHGRICI